MIVYKRICEKFVVSLNLFLFVLLVCSVMVDGVNADELNDLRKQWLEGKYLQAYEGLKVYRKTPYGKNAEVYYMIGSCLCRMDETCDLGRDYLQCILDNHSIDKDQRKIINEEKDKCVTRVRVRPVLITFNDTRSSAGVSGRAKMFSFIGEDAVLGSNPVEVVENIPREVITSRLFEKSRQEEAKKSVKKLTGSESIIELSEHFILASSCGRPKSQVQEQIGTLEDVFDFFVRWYQMRPPQHFITVYWVTDSRELLELSEKLHGIRLAPNSVGYSYRDDLSMIVSAASGSGTLLHELLHLMVRNNFGDIPPWLDEGMAAIYETCTISSQRVWGLPNWRGRILNEYWSTRPSIEKLVTMDWRAFNAEQSDDSMRKQATNHAMSRYFVLYLQDRGMLLNVYKDFYNREVGTDTSQLLKKRFPQGLNQLDSEFGRWFKDTYVKR